LKTGYSYPWVLTTLSPDPAALASKILKLGQGKNKIPGSDAETAFGDSGSPFDTVSGHRLSEDASHVNAAPSLVDFGSERVAMIV
jgi:hypothetical protein